MFSHTSKTIHLSRKGMNAFKRAIPLWYGTQNQLLERLGLERREQLDDMLGLLTEPLAANHA